jgi:hypothetical protein
MNKVPTGFGSTFFGKNIREVLGRILLLREVDIQIDESSTAILITNVKIKIEEFISSVV